MALSLSLVKDFVTHCRTFECTLRKSKGSGLFESFFFNNRILSSFSAKELDRSCCPTPFFVNMDVSISGLSYRRAPGSTFSLQLLISILVGSTFCEDPKRSLPSVFRIRDHLVRIRIRKSIPLINISGS